MGSKDDVRLNKMGIAVMLHDPEQLPPELRDKSQLFRLSAGMKYVLKQQAKVFLEAIKDPLLRKHFCTCPDNSGQGIVVAPSGKTEDYDLSPYFKKALEYMREVIKEDHPKGKLTDVQAKDYVGQVMRLAGRLRGKQRSGKGLLQPTLHADDKARLPREQRERLLNSARQALQRAYARYSNFRVGAAVLTQQGEIFTGCNVENASYGLTICAERAAIFTAVQQTRATKLAIRAVAVVNGDELPCAPCGACRQVIFEFGENSVVIFRGQQGYQQLSITDLLPESFRLS